jgi:thioredoxin reductase
MYDVVILGGGPAGLSAAIAAHEKGARVLLIEREEKLGGILKQCIHDGFGLLNFKELLTGPEYAGRYIARFLSLPIEYLTSTFVLKAEKSQNGFSILAQNKNGIETILTKTLVLACGCRERTSRQVFMHGDRPAGIFSAGTAQYLVNILGVMPTKQCVILGSGDIGLIMARRLTLEGAKVLGVYEIKPEPSGLTRNIVQCLDDFEIPLHLSKSVSRVFGKERVEAVEICSVDEKMQPIPGTEERVACDAVILSVGLIPENEIAESLGITMDKSTKGPVVDQHLMTSVEGVFCCGNALHVNDLVDYVSQSGETAGESAAVFSGNRPVQSTVHYNAASFLYVVPQKISGTGTSNFYFRTRRIVSNMLVRVEQNGKKIFEKKYSKLLPSEMECIQLTVDSGDLTVSMEER